MDPKTVEMTERPCRVGYFTNKESAERAVRDLMAAGFDEKEIAIIWPTKGIIIYRPMFRRRSPLVRTAPKRWPREARSEPSSAALPWQRRPSFPEERCCRPFRSW